MTNTFEKPAVIVVAGLLALLMTPTHAVAWQDGDMIEGYATAKDGDGVMIREIEIRLQGVAAPEDNRFRVEEGGTQATQALAFLVDRTIVHCRLDGTLARKRPVGTCYSNGRDLAETLIRSGYARDCPRFSGGRYRTAEMEARSNGHDLSEIYELPSYCLPK